ncbi:hypothetical protein GCM10011317_13500 [Niveispirillum cyanobacteriorum]|nr:hypothetical protein GCM10011317_13500 [Niveispirillum cyanobacteriorum]
MMLARQLSAPVQNLTQGLSDDATLGGLDHAVIAEHFLGHRLSEPLATNATEQTVPHLAPDKPITDG